MEVLELQQVVVVAGLQNDDFPEDALGGRDVLDFQQLFGGHLFVGLGVKVLEDRPVRALAYFIDFFVAVAEEFDAFVHLCLVSGLLDLGFWV